MFRSFKLGTAFGIGIYVHWTFLLLPAWVFFANLELVGWLMGAYAVAVVLAVFGCVVLHELGHAMAARRFGIPTRDITLYPIGGVARLERMSEKPWEECYIAIAGPLVNVVIAGLLWGFFLVSDVVGRVVSLPPLGLMFLYHLMFINVGLVLFNLLPAFPMDGGRVLRALLALRVGRLKATQVAVYVGVVLAVGMALFGLVGPESFRSPFLPIMAAFVYLAGQQELAAVAQREEFRRQEEYGFPHQDRWNSGADFEAQSQPRRDARVYLWDERSGRWVEQPPLRPVDK
jgi:Zn-dependent protease